MSGRPLLCELHAHSTWSDGDLSISGARRPLRHQRFDVLCVTDHVGRERREVARPALADHRRRRRSPTTSARSSRRPGARDVEYGLLVVPGLELTYDDDDPARRGPCGRDRPAQPGLPRRRARAARSTAARAAGAALIAAHPYAPDDAAGEPPVGPVAGQSPGMRSPASSIATSSINRRDDLPVGRGGRAARRRERRLPPPTSTCGRGRRSSCCTPAERSLVTLPALDRPAYLVDLAEPALLEAAA